MILSLITTKPPPSPKTSLLDKRRKSDNLVLIQSIKNDLRRILAKRNSLSLTDLNDDDDDGDISAQYADILRLSNGGSSSTGSHHKTARSLSTIPSGTPGAADKSNSKWLKKLSTKATMAIKKSFENIFFG